MPSGLPPLKITAGGYDFSYEAENITFSSVDPGGYEMASFDLQSARADELAPGMAVRLTDGMQTVWEGRIAEPARNIHHGWHVTRRINSATTRVSCEGNGAMLKDNQFSMVYIDRDLSRWQTTGIVRQMSLISSGFNVSAMSWQLGADTRLAQPGLFFSAQGPLVGKPIAEAYYDSGPLNTISRIRFTHQGFGYGAADANNQFWVSTVADTSATNASAIGVGGDTSIHVEDKTLAAQRFALFQHWYNLAASTGAAGTVYGTQVYGISVLGNHGLPLRGTAPFSDGFYISDIAAHAVQSALAAGAHIKLGQMDQFSAFVLTDYAQYTPVTYEQVVADMAKLGPAHFGTWESSSIFDDTPEFTFRAYGTQATAFMSLADSDEVDLSERLANLYTTAIITYSDAAGNQFSQTVTLPNAVLDKVSLKRTTVLDLGISSAAAATTFAGFVLQALYAQARAAGSVALPRRIRDANGASKASYWLKAGIDRLYVSDIPARSGTFTGADKDSFRISRIESNVDTSSGEIVSRVELDAGPNLVELLQARLEVANKIAGY